MRRYRFALESALRARRAQEDLARQRLGEVNRRLAAARSGHERALAAYRAIPRSASALERDAFVAHRAYEAGMAREVERARREAVDIEVEAAVCYAAWVEAGKMVASLERLEQRRRAEWEEEVRRDEALAVDDVVASRWGPAGAGGGR